MFRGLDPLHADLALLLGAGSADPHYGATQRAVGVVFEDQFDGLTTLQVKGPVQAEAVVGGIHHQAGNPLLVSIEVNDQAGALLCGGALGMAALGDGRGGHLASISSEYEREIASCQDAARVATARGRRAGTRSPTRPGRRRSHNDMWPLIFAGRGDNKTFVRIP